jgi:hypothetical protein
LSDNLTAHKGERVKELIELLYLPPYSPDFDPTSKMVSVRPRTSGAKPKPVAERLFSK